MANLSVYEGTWEEIKQHETELAGRRFRLVPVQEEREPTDEELAEADARLERHIMSHKEKEPTAEEIAESNARLEACMVTLGYSIGTDNEQIDADLAREYGNNHENSYKVVPLQGKDAA